MRNKVLLTQYRVKKRVNLTDRIFIDRLTALFPNDRHVAAAFFLLYQPKGNGSIGQLAAVRIQRAAIGGHFNVLFRCAGVIPAVPPGHRRSVRR